MRAPWRVAVVGMALVVAAGAARAQPVSDADAGVALDAAPEPPPGPTCAELYSLVRTQPSPEVLLAYGECRERADDLTEASRRYREAALAARDTGNDELRRVAYKRYAAIVERTSMITLDRNRVSMDAWVAYSLDGRPIPAGREDISVRVLPGAHSLVAVRPGCTRWSHDLVAEAGKPMKIKLPSLRCHGEPVPPAEASSEEPFAATKADDASDDADTCVGCYLIGTGVFLFTLGAYYVFKPSGSQSASATLGTGLSFGWSF